MLLKSIAAKSLKISPILFLIVSSFVLFKSNVNAAIANKVVDRNYLVQKDYVEITETKTIRILEPGFIISPGSFEGFTIFNPIKGEPNAEEKLKKTLESIKISDQFGNEYNYETEESSSNNLIVKVVLPTNISYGKDFVLNLNYKSYGLLISAGAVKDVYIPGYPKDYNLIENNFEEIINTKVVIPKSLPEINFVLPEVDLKDVDDFIELDIPINELLGSSAWIQLGKEQYFSFIIEQDLPKTTSIPFVKNKTYITLPRDISSGSVNQTVFFTDISPNPSKVFLDENGNLIAEFAYNANSAHKALIKGYAILRQEDQTNLTESGNISDIPQEFSKYLLPAKYWEVNDDQIKKIANQIKGNSTNIYEIVEKTYDYIVDKIDYSFVKKHGLNERQGALQTLNGGAAVCMEYSDLFITLMRANGIPARAAFGYGYAAADYESRLENYINHQWAEVYFPNLKKWISVDVTWGEFGSNIVDGDLNHFYSHLASADPDTPSTSEISFFGKLDKISDRKMEIIIEESLAVVTSDTAKRPETLLNEYTGNSSFSSNLLNPDKLPFFAVGIGILITTILIFLLLKGRKKAII